MIAKRLRDVTEADILGHVSNQVSEGKTIEFKRELPGSSYDHKKEFLADISSFANTVGGDLIFGVVEEKGIASKVVGVQPADRDQEIRRLDGIITSGLDPRIRYEIHQVPLADERLVLIVRAERSWLGPHRVTLSGHDKFYGRTSAGKYSLDVAELRVAFGFSQTLVERLRSFRTDRIMALANNEAPVLFEPGAKIVLHCIPFQSFDPLNLVDIAPFYSQPQKIPPLRTGGGWNHRINLDGLVTFTGDPKACTYTQVYRSGIIESVDGSLLYRHGDQWVIPSVAYEQVLLEHLPKCLKLLKELGLTPPIAVALAMVNVRGIEMSKSFLDFSRGYPINQDHLLLPESVIETLDDPPGKILKPLFDLVWNACGYAGSRNFNEKSEWINRPT